MKSSKDEGSKGNEIIYQAIRKAYAIFKKQRKNKKFHAEAELLPQQLECRSKNVKYYELHLREVEASVVNQQVEQDIAVESSRKEEVSSSLSNLPI